jgi:hypothetical protein
MFVAAGRVARICSLLPVVLPDSVHYHGLVGLVL